ncbi:MAG: hypothetical protein JNG86_20375 [Verrucomicrobiaceae bacterium]|nr:hypothetical protein [Verrucomicrobiaceae bacterium]
MARPLASLILIATLCGVFWRAELEWRWGWASLRWGWQLYWAFLVGALLFTTWVVAARRLQHPIRLALVLVSFFAIILAFLWKCLEPIYYIRWLLPPPDSEIFKMQLLVLSLPLFWALVPLSFGWICRWHGIRAHFGLHLLSSVLFVLSWPFAVWLLEVTEHRGGADLIHALKSGFVIPPLVVSLGFPLLFAKRADKTKSRQAINPAQPAP